MKNVKLTRREAEIIARMEGRDLKNSMKNIEYDHQTKYRIGDTDEVYLLKTGAKLVSQRHPLKKGGARYSYTLSGYAQDDSDLAPYLPSKFDTLRKQYGLSSQKWEYCMGAARVAAEMSRGSTYAKIAGIKAIRERTGLSLGDVKTLIEKIVDWPTR